MEEATPIGFLDVPLLLDASEPRPGVPWIWLATATSIGLMVVAAISGSTRVELSDVSASGATSMLGLTISAVASALAVGIFLSLPLFMRFAMKQLRAEQSIVAAAADLLHLRRWPEAAIAIQQILSRPVRTMQLRSEVLVYLASILTRYHRFSDAITVHNYILDNELVSPGTAYGLKLARAVAMLREDHLVDADRALSDLRRIGPEDSAAFALVDMYRDVKTGHPDEALKIFHDKLPAMRDQLGHRLADAYALAARAYDLLDRKAEAADAFYRATLLAPFIELARRYPEFQKLAGRYEAAIAPPELAEGIMLPVDVAIHRVRRDITLGMLLKATLIAAVFACLIFAPPSAKLAALLGVLGIWIALSVTSARSSRLAMDSPMLIAAGEFEEAERQIDQAMRAFTLFSPAKLRALHQLAVLRHAQRRWEDAAAICRALLRQRPTRRQSLTKPSRLILAESLLELNELPGSYLAIRDLYSQQLSLDEVLNVLSLQLDYEAKIGQWGAMFNGVVSKVQLAELMPSAAAARVQAFLGLAALKSGRTDWADWLRRRSELLVDVNSLTGQRPLLSDLWTSQQSAARVDV